MLPENIEKYLANYSVGDRWNIISESFDGIDNVVVIPSVIANAVNLHPVEVILGIMIIGGAFGTVGVILAIPAIATAKIIYHNLYADIQNTGLKSDIRR